MRFGEYVFFRFLFSQDREALLELYNVLSGTHHADASELKIVTLEDVVYLSMKNDLAFIVAGDLNMYEHQSTYNPNMPLRFFLYLGQEYRKLIAGYGKGLYGSKLIELPTPQCVVFYNGNREMPDETVLRLSDAFGQKDRRCGVELEVRLLNINYGHNRQIMEGCRRLGEYACFVDMIRKGIQEGMETRDAVDWAVTRCVQENVLTEFLEQHRMEVMEMILTEYNEKETMEYLRREAIEIGMEEGLQEGIQEGIREGELRFAGLIQELVRLGRLEDLSLAAAEEEYRKQLYREFGL